MEYGASQDLKMWTVPQATVSNSECYELTLNGNSYDKALLCLGLTLLLGVLQINIHIDYSFY